MSQFELTEYNTKAEMVGYVAGKFHLRQPLIVTAMLRSALNSQRKSMDFGHTNKRNQCKWKMLVTHRAERECSLTIADSENLWDSKLENI